MAAGDGYGHSMHIGQRAADDTCPDKHKGSRTELLACAWLLHNGYEVFRNVSTYGPIDIVAFKKGKILLLDVKGCRDKKHATACQLSAEQLAAGIEPLYVFGDGTCAIGLPAASGGAATATRVCSVQRQFHLGEQHKLQRPAQELRAICHFDENLHAGGLLQCWADQRDGGVSHQLQPAWQLVPDDNCAG